MPNEFIIKNGYFSQGSSQITGSLNVSAGITGSLLGTASYATQALSASFTSTASFVQTAQTASYVLNAVSSSFASTASFAPNYVLTSVTSSMSVASASVATTASYALNALSASFATSSSRAVTASFAISASWAPATSPGGSDQAVQFNKTSTFSGSTFFTYDYTLQSLKQGYNNYVGVNGTYATAFGYQSSASAEASFAQGYRTQTLGSYTHAEGNTTTAGLLGYHSTDIGLSVAGEILLDSTYGDLTYLFSGFPYYILLNDIPYSPTYGSVRLELTSASFDGSSTILYLADNTISTSEANIGLLNTPFGPGADRAMGDGQHAEGLNTLAANLYSHAEGNSTIAAGLYSHAEGRSAYTIGRWSHAEGNQTTTVGEYSHAEGNFTTAYGAYSHAGGIGTIASGSGQTVVGTFNTDGNTTSLFVVGNGSSPFAKSDLALFDPTQITFNQPLIVSSSLTTTGSVVITGSLRGNVSTLSISSNTASVDMTAGNFFTLTLVNGANTFINPTNLNPGQTVNIRVTQGNAGTGTVTFPSFVDQPSGSAYTASAVSNAIDIVTMITFDSTTVFLSSVRNMI